MLQIDANMQAMNFALLPVHINRLRYISTVLCLKIPRTCH
jgi:hypothetical protein